MYGNLALLAALVLAYSLVAGAMGRSVFGGAIAFTVAGLAFGPSGLAWLEPDIGGEELRLVAELALALVLFTDAASVDLKVLRRNFTLPARLLLVGLPLTIVLGWLAGILMLGDMGWLEVALLAVLLAPTDAALGKAVVTNPAVPTAIRSALNVESGLNDGICVPLVLILLVLAADLSAQASATATLVLVTFMEELGIGALVGVGCIAIAVPVVRLALRRGWSEPVWLPFVVPALALLCFALAQSAGGSGFIACFVGGLVAGGVTRADKHVVLRSAEGFGEVLALLTWVVFGALVVGPTLRLVSLEIILYAIASLTVLRMLPVWLALIGSGLTGAEKLFVGWFGPRGLASMVFTILILGEGVATEGALAAVAGCTIALSVLAHGLTAGPLATALGRRQRLPDAPQAGAVG